MSKFELSIAKDYVPSWNHVDAVREIFQNALDQQTTIEGNDMFFDYDEDSKILRIGNRLSVLSTNSLLLGSSTKADDDSTIGQFGEGYKIATLVLTRLNKSVVFYNYGAREVWNPRFVNSRRYGAEILTFFVDKKYPWQSVPHHNLIIEIENISESEYAEIKESNLHINKPERFFETTKGRILLEPKYKSKVFVNGLFICDHKEYEYGYDFKPSNITIDRDRKLVNSFDLHWLASGMWINQTSDEMVEILINLISKGSADAIYVNEVSSNINSYQKTSNKVHDKFKSEYGEKAIPVSTQEELESLPKEYKPVMVKEVHYNSITSSSNYEPPKIVKKDSPKKRLNKWLGYYRKSLSNRAKREIESIIKDLD